MELTNTEMYDCARNADEVAKERGQVVVYPLENQLQFDIDSDEQLKDFEQRIADLESYEAMPAFQRQDVPSKTPGCRHIYLTFPTKKFTEVERMLWQASLGDDPRRVYLNFVRLQMGDEKPSRLFEKALDKGENFE
jgi:hypothetical protein